MSESSSTLNLIRRRRMRQRPSVDQCDRRRPGRSFTSLRCGSLNVFNDHSSTPHETDEAATGRGPAPTAAAASADAAITVATRQNNRIPDAQP